MADGWNALADALEEAAQAARRRTPAARFRAICAAYRAWALDRPHWYRLALETRYGSGRFAPETTLPAAGRAMVVLLDAVAGLGPSPGARPRGLRALDAQLEQWLARSAPRDDLPSSAVELAVLTWTRLHGTVSLELVGVFDSMGLDPALLHRVEVDHLLDQIGGGGGTGADAA